MPIMALPHVCSCVVQTAAVSVPVNIVLCKHCSFGESLALVGDVPELGDWDTNKAVQLQVGST